MALIQRVRTILAGFAGGPGVITCYGLDGAFLSGVWQGMLDNMKASIPSDVTMTVEPSGDIIEATTGELTGSWSRAPLPPVTGTNGEYYAAPVGVMAKWSTSTVVDSHRLRGRTFFVPFSGASWNTQGQVSTDTIAFLQPLLAATVASAVDNFVVWHRPLTAAEGARMKPPRAARAGSYAFVTGSSVATKAVVLRSRRD